MFNKKHKKGTNPLVAGAIGAVVGIGAAAAAVAATQLKDKNNRKKVVDTLKTVGDTTGKYIEEVKTNIAKQQKKEKEVTKELKN